MYEIQISVSSNKVLLEHSCALLIHIMSKAAFVLLWQGQAAASEAVWTTEPEMYFLALCRKSLPTCGLV